MKLLSAEFVTSVGPASPLPVTQLPQVALVGRSNVGKSTLINALAKKKIARAGGAPGTTRLLNVYQFELAKNRGNLLLIDLPGYGYARGRDAAAQEFAELTGRYFQADLREEELDRPGQVGPAGAVLLVDGRHPGLDRDREALEWLIGLDLPMIVAATKMDRLKRSQRLKVVKQHETALGTGVLPISAPKGDGLGPFWMALLGLARL
ncbi:MAG: ribosome biogenesis GTP-binding protein YsxC [Acidobacteria bacterium]|nr:ribosome biogenesis GTP-binding protein YsxC [Acidobacteriota bacterium]|tara:strand:- start:1313 stop:1933 length:621 start_codon:yes stop_codon:yes gene_type:complete